MKKKVMLKGKLLRVSIALIALFTATIFFVTNNRVNNLIENNISEKLITVSNLGMDIIKSKSGGDWNVKGGKLFAGEYLVSSSFEIIDEIKKKTDALIAIYLKDEIVTTSVVDKNGEMAIGAVVSDKVSEKVLKKGDIYEGIENINGEKYAVKYMPIADKAGKVIGIWFVGIPKSYVGSQVSNIFAMRSSIVVISILCGVLGCVALMLYSRRYLSDIDTHKVLFLEPDTNSNKTQHKVLRMSLFLIATFFLIWFSIQSFTIGNVVNNLDYNNIKDRVNVSSELGYMFIDEHYDGDWSIKNDKLFKGTNSLNDSSVIIDRISSITESYSTVLIDDKGDTKNITTVDGTKPIGIKVPDDAIGDVLRQGREYTGETNIADKRCITRYKPIKDSRGKAVGMWVVGIEKEISKNHIAGLRKNISQISILAIIIAFVTFLFLSVKMVSEVKNFDVSLHTNVNY